MRGHGRGRQKSDEHQARQDRIFARQRAQRLQHSNDILDSGEDYDTSTTAPVSSKKGGVITSANRRSL